jgi:hypothetical protein
MSRWKVLPHRLGLGPREGQCRDCGRLVVTTAPDSCARCALERYSDQGFVTVTNPVVLFEEQGWELWRGVAQDLPAGQIAVNRFYLWVGHGDAGPLERAPDELVPEREFAHASRAHQAGVDLTGRYPQVWVVTIVGCWCITSRRY